MSKKSILIILCSVLSVMVTQISKAAVIHVTTTHDNVPGSLRAAITTVNNNGEDNTIYLPAGTYMLSGDAMEDANVSGDLDINTDRKLTIIGSGKTKTFIDGNSIDRVLHILNGTVTITDLTIRKGKAPNGLGLGWGRAMSGGGIYNCGNLTLTRCVIKNNAAGIGGDAGNIGASDDGGHGGGIYNIGELTLDNCTIIGNRAGNGGDNNKSERPGDGGYGGGICNYRILTINNCTVTGNSAGNGGSSDDNIMSGDGGHGGGIYSTDVLNMVNCTISYNKAGDGGMCDCATDGDGGPGGGICNDGNLTMSGCTVNANNSGSNLQGSGVGGGIYNSAYLTLTNCTISGNQAGRDRFQNGGGLFNEERFNGGSSLLINVTAANNIAGGILNYGDIRLINSIVVNNVVDSGDGPDCVGTFDWVCYSMIKDTRDCILTVFQKANILGQDALLGPLADNGGPTKTHALLLGSPAIDAGNSSGLFTDQRGYKRPINIPGIPNVSDGADIGAYEFIAPYSTAGATSYSGSESKQATLKR
ncbi:MAG: hypothetical protein NT166_23750 [Candidatus Aminicenantes bacterium]|nr:hypothetical protein [Candidatus Aminicenantes bacterium]